MELQEIFTVVLNMTVTGTIVIGCVLAARAVLGRAPRVFAWMLWLVVIFRLLCPVSLPGPVSVLELVDAPRSQSGAVEFVELPAGAAPSVLPGPGLPPAQVPPSQAEPFDWHLLFARVWAVGAAALLVHGIVSYGRLKRRLRESVPAEKGVREADGIASPFVLGRRVYLPAGLAGEERAYVLLHERLHIRHGDPAVKAVFWLAVCIHWFNPAVWLAFALCGRDMELRCDEAVLKRLGTKVRSDYAQSLLRCAAGGRFAPAPLAFGEGDTGRRVRFVLGWKGSRFAIPAAVLCAAVLLVTGCDPAPAGEGPFGHSYRVSGVVTAPGQTPEVPELFTLTSDTVLTVRQDGETVMYEALKGVASGTPLPVTMPEGTQGMMKPLENTWKTPDDAWWLFRKKGGELYLWREGAYLVKLERADLLDVTIEQPGIVSRVEPVWYQPGDESRHFDTLSTTPVDGKAWITLESEQAVDTLQVREEYYEVLENGEYAITTTDHILHGGTSGDFTLEVSRRGGLGDDFAIYRVSVGEDHYLFRLTFVTEPWETTVAAGMEERTITYAEAGAAIILRLPGDWSYTVVSLEEAEINAGIAGGISFWPTGREEGKLFFGYYPDRFAVCGTGLETTEMALAGQTASVGTYDGARVWDFISFGEAFAVWGQGHEVWWDEYGQQAMEILNSAQFSMRQPG